MWKGRELLWLETNEIREQSARQRHPDHITSLNNLANLYEELYRYSDSDHCCESISATNQLGQCHVVSFRTGTCQTCSHYQYNRDELNYTCWRHAKGAPHGILHFTGLHLAFLFL